MLSTADQDYIKAIYSLQEKDDTVSTSHLARFLGVTPASVSGMLKKLHQARLVRYNRYQGASLTRQGRNEALKVLRRHRLLELFLVKVLGFPWELVHQEAERLEHVISDEFEQRLDKLLGYPTVDPQGAPIPTENGQIDDTQGIALSQIEEGASGRVTEVQDGDPALLKHLAGIGLVPGARVKVIERVSFDDSLVLKIGRSKQSVSNKVASAVLVMQS